MKPLLAAVFLASVAWAQPYTPESFAAELDRLDSALDQSMAETSNRLPGEWYVNAERHSYAISTGPLKERLRESHSASAREWIAGMRQQVQSFNTPQIRDGDDDQATLKAVLARPQFKAVGLPSAIELLWRRFMAWLGEWLGRLFAFAAQHPTGSQVLFWTLVAAAVLGLGGWLYAVWERAGRIPSLPASPPLEHKLLSWQEWLLAAREAASKGDHRQAIRSAYWSAVARLQQDGALRINLTDTPRERLRRLAQPGRKSVPLSAAQLDPLTTITTTFERYWYAKLPVHSDDVVRAFENLEALGCKAD
jgi:hypothetical protein